MEKKLMRICAMFFVALLSVGFIACSSDDEDEYYGGSAGKWGNVPAEIASKIQGTWDFESGTSTTMGYTVNMSRSDVEQMGRQMGVSFWDLTLTFTSNKVNGAGYNVDGRKLIIEGADAVAGLDITIQSLTESTLVLRESFSLEGMEFSCTLTYRKR
ncbi:MAG: hypothetical protein IJT13_05610 [Bacteroidaceae bacterium]|nr:hypothetical protein [Bacteroidaceae bacterium]